MRAAGAALLLQLLVAPLLPRRAAAQNCRFDCGTPPSCAACTGAKEGWCLQSEANCAQCGGVWCPTPAPPPAPTIMNLKGVSEAGAEFGQAIPGADGTDYTTHFPSIEHFAGLGFGAVRLPFGWERLQRTLRGDFAEAYLAAIDRTVDAATRAGMHVILDPHNYARYATSGTIADGKVIGAPGSGVTVADFVDFWTRLANHYKANPNVVFAIMNEPNTMSTRLWADTAQAAMNAIRQTGANQLVLVPGNGWTGAHSWLETWYDTDLSANLSNAVALANFTDPGGNFAFEMHQYLDSDSSGSSGTCVSKSFGVDALSGATSWLEQRGFRGFIGEFAGGANPLCAEAVGAMLTHMDEHPAWIGWTYWAAGPWWGTNWDSIEPLANGTDAPQTAWLLKHLS